MPTKQVLVMLKFPKARNIPIGKYVSQGSHASLGAFISQGHVDETGENLIIPLKDPFFKAWIFNGSYKKITCYVETPEELEALYQGAQLAGLPASLITDAGHTEFKNVPTLTAVGIGPAQSEKIDALTKNLPLFR